VAVMAEVTVAMAGTLADMSRPPMLRADTMALVFAAGAVTSLRATRVATRAMRDARITRLAAVIGEVITAIRTLDIRGLAITAWAIALRTTDMVITVTAPVGAMIRTTDIVPADTILIDTGTGPTWASVSGSAAIKLSRH
jgi:hypothetical protein